MELSERTTRLVRGPDGVLYDVTGGICDARPGQAMAPPAFGRTPAAMGRHGSRVKDGVSARTDSGNDDYASALPNVDPGDYASALPNVDPGDYASALPNVDPGDMRPRCRTSIPARRGSAPPNRAALS